VAEEEDGAQGYAGISAPQKALLGTAHVGARLLLRSTGNVTDEVIAEYIAHQQDHRDDDFKVDG